MTDNYAGETIGRGTFRSWARLALQDLDLGVSPWHVKELTANYDEVILEVYYLDRDGARINIRGYADGKAVTYTRKFPVADQVSVFWPEYVGAVAA